jgi:hypothetical protein
MNGDILFLDHIMLQPVGNNLFAIDATTAHAADVHLLVGNTVGIEVRAQSGNILVSTADTAKYAVSS